MAEKAPTAKPSSGRRKKKADTPAPNPNTLQVWLRSPTDTPERLMADKAMGGMVHAAQLN